MAVDVPTADDAKDSAKTGAVRGGVLGVGELVGRGILGRGLGTAAGGVAAAASMNGNARDTAATIAVERGLTELMAGSGGGGSTRQERRL